MFNSTIICAPMNGYSKTRIFNMPEFSPEAEVPKPNDPLILGDSKPLDAAAFHNRSTFVDIHAHPSLKVLLFNKELHKSYWTPPFTFPFTLRSNFPSLQAGGVDVLVASHYVPERSLRDDCWPLKGVARLLPNLNRIFTGEPDQVLDRMITQFEAAVSSACEKIGPVAQIVRSYSEMELAREAGRMAIIHSIEGTHTLNGKIENVAKLFERGVCSMILAHFYPNELVASVEGIPHDLGLRKLGTLRKKADLSKGLTPFGQTVAEKMLELGMIVDLTHSTPMARSEIFDLNHNRRPIIFSHVGVKDLANFPMNPDKAEVRAVAESGGVIGVVAMNYWLVGEHGKDGIDHMINTMKHIIQYGGEDSVAIGSDFDGFTNPPNDLKEPADFPKLTEKMLQNFSPSTVEKILGKNYLRVLRDGWGKK